MSIAEFQRIKSLEQRVADLELRLKALEVQKTNTLTLPKNYAYSSKSKQP